MSAWMLAILVICLLRLPLSAVGARLAAAPESQRITFSFRATPLRQALETLFRDSGQVLVIEPEVPDSPVTLSLDDLEFAAALRSLAKVAGLTYRREGDRTYVIGRRARENAERTARPAEPPAGQEIPEKRFTFAFKNLPFRQALGELFRGAGETFTVAPDVPNPPITLDLRDVPFVTALRVLVRQAGATFAHPGDRYVIQKRPPTPPQPPARGTGTIT